MVRLEVEGYKKTRSIKFDIAPTGLTELVGKNKQGKTSNLEALVHALFGPKFVDLVFNPINEDAVEIPGTRGAKARIVATFDNGMKVERRLTERNQRTGILEITLPDGSTGSTEDIMDLLSPIALQPPSIDGMSQRELLKYLMGGLGIDMTALEEEYKLATKAKEDAYQAKEQARRAHEDLPYYEDAPAALVSIAELSKQYQDAATKNEENKAKRSTAANLENAHAGKHKESVAILEEILDIGAKIIALQNERSEKEKQRADISKEEEEILVAIDVAENIRANIVDISTETITAKMENAESINENIRANIAKAKKGSESESAKKYWRERDEDQAAALNAIAEIIKNADVPIAAIGVEFIDTQWCVTFDGQPRAGMSGMQKILLRTAIASMYNKNARLVCVDGLEALDDDMQEAYNKFLHSRGLQSLSTVVRSDKGESSFARLLIHDGEIKE